MVEYRDPGNLEEDNRTPSPLVGLAGPSIVTEFLENGSLVDLLVRVTRARVQVPNRVLWFIMLCRA